MASSQNETSVVSNLVITGESFPNGAKESDEMADMLERLWQVESLEIADTNCESELIKRKGDITFNASHYEVELPWRGDCLPQSNNYEMCVTVIAFKIGEGAELLKEEKERKGSSKTVPETEDQTLDESKLNTKRIHYSPHHTVLRRDRETTKVGIVFSQVVNIEATSNFFDFIWEVLLKVSQVLIYNLLQDGMVMWTARIVLVCI